MRFLSVCSGIEAASVAWNPLGWKAVAFSEIEPFPCAVLAHHYPDTPNWGDMTKFQEWPDEPIDLLCGGTPCQSFSVAGLRKGLDDPRGNLMLTFGAIAAKYRPKWLVWENVPGVLSSNGGRDFASFLDMLEELGYVFDVEILDAQFFGIPQRRRRVFVCGQHRDDLLKQKTDSSALTIAQCLQEILHSILIEASSRFGKELEGSGLAYLSRDGLKRRMRLFGILGDQENWPLLRNNLVEAFLRQQAGRNASDASHGENEKERTPEGQLMVSSMESPFTLTEQSLKKVLDDAYQVMKSFITSTPTNSTTQAQIFTCSRAALLIGRLTLLLSQSSPPFWSAASSCLIAIEEFIDYARYTSSDLFGDVERVQAWLDFLVEADGLCESIGDIGIECFGSVLPVPDSLSGNPAPSRQTGQRPAPTLSARTQGGGGLGTDFKCNSGLIPSVSQCITTGTGQRYDPETETETILPVLPFDTTQITNAANFSSPKPGDPCHPLAAGAHAPAIAFDCKSSGHNGFGIGIEIAGTQRAMASTGSHQNGGGHQAVVTTLAIRGRGDYHNLGTRTDGTANALLTPNGGRAGIGVGAIHYGMQVRRLTPEECEALQAFPRNYTRIPWRKKPADQCPDGPRYKALGNSWCVNNVRWIGERIEQVNRILESR
nr:DNA (cytosine-5-)-methyltransferase [Alcaligenes sp. YSL9]